MIKLLRLFGSIRITVACLFLLCVLTVLGTLYQKDHGLHLAQERFFYSWIILAGGFLPLPGGLVVMTVLAVNLLISFFVHFLLGARFVGVWLVHTGLLLMLGGGAFTMLTGKSGYVFLLEGESSNVLTAYHDWEVAVWRGEEGAREVQAVDWKHLRTGETVSFPASGLTVRPERMLGNADGYLKTDRPVDASLESPSGIVELRERKPELEPERNLPALIATVTGPGGAAPRRVLLYGADEKPAQWKDGDTAWSFRLQRRREELPVNITLADFHREVHPNSKTPKSFASRVAVGFPNGVEREVDIEMNQPFRHQGYTFYQASFSETGSTQGSKFAVTFNHGRLLPYVATTLTTVGLVVHFGLQLAATARQRRRSPP